MKTVYTTTESIHDLLKDTVKEPVLIQGPDELAGVLLSVETYELLGRYDDGMLNERDDEKEEPPSEFSILG